MRINSDVLAVDDNLILPKTTGVGIKVDPDSPTFGWRDITTQINARGTGANDPAFAVYTGTALRAYQFSATILMEVFMVFHVPHDYVPGTDIFFHVGMGGSDWGAGDCVMRAYEVPATHYVSSGLINGEFDGVMQDANLLHAACVAKGAQVTLAQCQALVTGSDVSGMIRVNDAGQEYAETPWQAFERLGLKLVASAMSHV